MASAIDKQIAICKSPFGDGKLYVTSFEFEEKMSVPFVCRAQFVSTDTALDFKKVIGKPIGIELSYEGNDPRYFHGICSRFSQGVFDGVYAHYSAEIVPELWLLTRRKNCRIFQEKSVPEILKVILGEHKVTNVDYRFKAGDYLPWVNCVQYQESDFDFISRLLEDEGIFYFFEYEADRHVLVFGDLPNHSKDSAEPKLSFRRLEGGAIDDTWVTKWEKVQELNSGKFALADYNFFDPGTKLLVNATTTLEVGENDRFEVFDYPGDFVKLGGEKDGKLSPGEKRVKVRMQEAAAQALWIFGESNSRHATPGSKFELQGHVNDAFNGKYLATSVTHRMRQSTDFLSGKTGTASYDNTFRCIPESVPFRPERVTEKPVIQGLQTAVVVGPEEIQIDEFARVRVLFHWDREGTKTGDSSCWIRVAESWAGKSFGTQFHPRIGWEVAVAFLEGDPNQPVIVGSLYNGENTVAFPAPTQAGILSRSTPDGTPENFNQLMFEDKKGSEEIYLKAERDWIIQINNDEKKNIDGNRSETVAKNVAITIEGNRAESVEGNRSLKVTGNLSESVTENKSVAITKELSVGVDGGMNLTVKKKRKMSVGGELEEDVGESMKVAVDKNLTTTIGKEETHTVGEARKVTAKSNTHTVKEAYKLEAKTVAVDAKEKIVFQSGKASITLEKGGKITIKGGKIEIVGEDEVKIKAPKVESN